MVAQPGCDEENDYWEDDTETDTESDTDSDSDSDSDSDTDGDTDDESQQEIIDEAFNIDITTIDVDFGYYPDENYVDAQSTATFTMKEDQTSPRFHFKPVTQSNPITPDYVRLNGETLSLSDPDDASIVSIDGCQEPMVEFNRVLEGGVEHTLEMGYRLDTPSHYPKFETDFSDIYSDDNASLYPTINCPGEIARHVMTLRVHSDTEYLGMGSGSFEQTALDVQTWELDTNEEVASYYVYFILVPRDDVVYEVQTIGDVEVRVAAYATSSVEPVFESLETWLPQLEADFGPFPMPTGLSVFRSNDGGMEYYGATATSLSALEHEVFHMYFARSAMPATYRDSWWDEAITCWYEDWPVFPIDDDYTSDMVGGVSPLRIGMVVDGGQNPYQEGAQIIAAVEEAVGGKEAMVAVLREIHENHSFEPFSTFALINYIDQYGGVDMYDEFMQWLYYGSHAEASDANPSCQMTHANTPSHMRKPDTTPPPEILRKYRTRH